jgi:hypothetical protein
VQIKKLVSVEQVGEAFNGESIINILAYILRKTVAVNLYASVVLSHQIVPPLNESPK